MIPTTEPTRLLSANNNTTATINHRHRAPTQSIRISFQSRDSSPEIVMILGSLPYEGPPSGRGSFVLASESGRPDLSCGRLRRSSLVSAVTSQTAFAHHILPPRLNLRFWRPPDGGRRELVCSSIRVGAPGFEPGTSASRTQRSTGLSHAPNFAHHRPENVPAGTRGARLYKKDHTPKRTGWD